MLKDDILKQLKETDGYVSGQDLCVRFGVTRTAVWKAIGRLKDEGYRIEAVRNRGYLLTEGADVLNGEEIEHALRDVPFIRTVEFHPQIDSTNTLAKRRAEEGLAGPALFVADEQLSGRGRRGRTWISPPGTGIWMTLLLKPDIPPEKASMLTLISAMAVADGVRNTTGLDAGIKWPNDVVVGGRKICGILTEMSADTDGIRYVVPGIGINANMESFPDEIARTATSLRIETGHPVNRAEIIGAVMREFACIYPDFIRDGSLKKLKSHYEALLVNRNRAVTVLDPAGEYSGTAEGITDGGELLVRTEDGKMHEVRSGEVSVRGIYGYI